MQRLSSRETFIALRARRQAHQIASDILNPHLELNALPCARCGHDVALDRRFATHFCPHCGAPLRLSMKNEVSLDYCDQGAPESVDAAVPRTNWHIVAALIVVDLLLLGFCIWLSR